MKVSIEWEGIAEVKAKLKKNAKLEDVKNIIKLNGSEMQQTAQRKAPVKTGFLKRHIFLDIEKNGLQARVTSQAPYAPPQEFGTRKMAGTPHVGPAFREQVSKYKRDINEVMK